MGMGVGRWSEYSEALLSLSLFISFTKRKKKQGLRALTPTRRKPPILLIILFLALVVLVGPTPPSPLTANDGGGGAEVEEGGRGLGRERDAGEGVLHVMWA